MIGRRRSGGFRGRTATGGATPGLLATVLVENPTGAEVTEPVSVGVSVPANRFDPNTMRLADGWEYGKLIDDRHGKVRHLTATKYVTVPASSSVQFQISSALGSATTPTAKTPSELLTMASNWDCELTFVDESATTWTNSARAAMGGSSVWAWNAAYCSAQALQDNSIVKEYICARPYFDSNPTANTQLACIFSASFYSNDNFTTIDRVRTQIIDHNAWYLPTAGDRIAYAGALTIRGSVSGQTIDYQYSDRAISSVSISWAGRVGTLDCATGNFTIEDMGKALTSSDGLAAIITFINSTTQVTILEMVGSAVLTSPTNVVIRGVRKAHMTSLIHDHWWNGAPALEARAKIQDIRNAKMLLNVTAGYDGSNIYSVLNDNPDYHRVSGAASQQEWSGAYQYGDDSVEMIDVQAGRILNTTDANGFITADALRLVRVSDRAFAATHFRQFFISKTTGLAERVADVASSRWDGDYTWVNPNWVHRMSLGGAHLLGVFYPHWLMTGDFVWQWATYHTGLTSLQLDGALGFNQFLPSGGPRSTACILYLAANAAAALPKTGLPTGTLLEGSSVPEASINNDNWDVHLGEAGVGRAKTTTNLPQWSDLQPVYTRYNTVGWHWHHFMTEYLFYSLMAAYETGSLKIENNIALRYLAGNSAGRVLIEHLQNTLAATPAIAQRNMYSSLGVDPGTVGKNLLDNTTTPITPESLWTAWHDMEYGSGQEFPTSYGSLSWASLIWALSEGVGEMSGIETQLQDAADYTLSVMVSLGNLTLDGNGDADWDDIDNWPLGRLKRVALRPRS